jgi:hypothetical protein
VQEATAEIENIQGQFVSGYSIAEGTIDASRALRTRPGRHVVFAITRLDRHWDSQRRPVSPEELFKALRDSNSGFWCVQIKPIVSETTNSSMVLTDAAWRSGGWRTQINDASSLETAAARLTAILTSQYVVTFAAAQTAKPQGVRVGVRRNGVKVSAAEYF